MKKDNEEEIRLLLKRIHKTGKTPELSRAQKKMILQEILPQKPFMLRFAPAMMAAMLLAVTFISYPAINASKPNSILYDVKRGIEDVRSFVQPSYNEELLERRDAEINDATNQGDVESVILIEKEKSEIEKRISSSETEDTNAASDDSSDQNNDASESSSDESNSHDNNWSEHSDNEETNSTQEGLTREECKQDLDRRKRSGENINSDMYKECDRL